MKKTKLIMAILVVLTSMSFKTSENLSLKTGTYGICNCDNNATMTAKTELLISDDFTFSYFDNFNLNKKIDIKGNWTRKGNTIYLKDYQSELVTHDEWTIDKNEKCLKSRKGLNFTRLCHIKTCEEKE